MRVIHKGRIGAFNYVAQFLSVIEARQSDCLDLYFLVNPDEQKIEKVIHVIGTGQEIHVDTLRYLGTVKMSKDTIGTQYIWHVFAEK